MQWIFLSQWKLERSTIQPLRALWTNGLEKNGYGCLVTICRFYREGLFKLKASFSFVFNRYTGNNVN